MDKKYQVFVSSTYEDLKAERQEVMHVLLELDCIPSGIELFPAADEDQWSLIKGVIDDCDYYIVIVAGRYGSIGPAGISYTEMEYRYAVDQAKPVVAFLHGDPGSIAQEFIETTDKGKAHLKAFCDRVRRKVCKEWTTPHELGSVVARSLSRLRKVSPGIGWVRGDQVSSRESAAEILRLRKKIDDLESKINEVETTAPPGTENLAQGDDKFEVEMLASIGMSPNYAHHQFRYTESVTWNEIFREISPLMIHECDDKSINRSLKHLFTPSVEKAINKSGKFKGYYLVNFAIKRDCFRTIIVQIRALGLIAKSSRPRSVKDKATYWTLTPYGDNVMNTLRAIKRSKAS